MPSTLDLDLGHGMTARWRYHLGDTPTGIVLTEPFCSGYRCRDEATLMPGGPCEGSVLFDTPAMAARFPQHKLWTVESLDPLTLAEAIRCGHHGCKTVGYIIDGKWEPQE